MIRVYVPTTLTGLARAQQAGALNDDDDGTPSGSTALAAHAVTGAVREWYTGGSIEELEYSAMTEAAEASLRLLAEDPQAPCRRVVIAVDVPDPALTPGGPFRSSVTVTGRVKLSKVASVHVDEPESEPTIRAAVAALPAADAGDEDARFELDEAEACDLLWYDISEIDDLIGG